MRITLVGVVIVIGSAIVLAFVVDEITKYLKRNPGNNNGQQNTPNQ
jgi:hypothetical protein